MTQMTRRSFILTGTAASVAGATGLSFPVAALPELKKYPIPTAPIPSFLEVATQLYPTANEGSMEVSWEFATDPYFQNIVNKDSVSIPLSANNLEDKLLKLTILDVPKGAEVYYRINCNNCDAVAAADTNMFALEKVMNVTVVADENIKSATIASREGAPTLHQWH